MSTAKGIEDLCMEHGLDIEQLASKSGVDKKRIQAIIESRWTPSPAERDRIAAVFGLTRDDIAWSGHKAGIEHIQGHGPQFGRSP